MCPKTNFETVNILTPEPFPPPFLFVSPKADSLIEEREWKFSRVDMSPRSLVIPSNMAGGRRRRKKEKGVTSGRFETLQHGMKSQRMSTLISKRTARAPLFAISLCNHWVPYLEECAHPSTRPSFHLSIELISLLHFVLCFPSPPFSTFVHLDFFNKLLKSIHPSIDYCKDISH